MSILNNRQMIKLEEDRIETVQKAIQLTAAFKAGEVSEREYRNLMAEARQQYRAATDEMVEVSGDPTLPYIVHEEVTTTYMSLAIKARKFAEHKVKLAALVEQERAKRDALQAAAREQRIRARIRAQLIANLPVLYAKLDAIREARLTA